LTQNVEKIILKNSKGEKIVGVLSVRDKKKPIIIICHGYNVNKDSFLYKDISKSLNENGFSTFRFDFSGYGESEGKREDATISKGLDDLKAVIDYIYNKNFKKIILLGHSLGGTISILESVENEKITALISLSSVTYPKKMKTDKFPKEIVDKVIKYGKFVFVKGREKYILTKEFFDDLEKYDILASVKKIKKPILIIHGKNDEKLNYKLAEELYQNANEPKEIVLIENADHIFSNKISRKTMIQNIIKFLNKIDEKHV
jgi:esterase/lipase